MTQPLVGDVVGDIHTHLEISQYVRDQIIKIFPGRVTPSDLSFLELGNYLTDVSQFRDPVAHHKGRVVAEAQALETTWVPDVLAKGKARRWATAMFGPRDTDPHGLLAEYFRHIALAVTHMRFSHPAGALLTKFPALSPSAVDHACDESFTQYWPHEHLDALPYNDGRTHRQASVFQRGPRGLINYLEWYLRYLSESLTKLEARWLAASGDEEKVLRPTLLGRLGHLLHAVEDYYFHSNYAELRQWQRVVARFPQYTPGDPEGYQHLARSILAGTYYPTRTVPHLSRVLNRRLRYPVYTWGLVLSTQTSDRADALLYTGGFGETDIWHTLGVALEGFEEKTIGKIAVQHLADSGLTLPRLLISAEARSQLVHDASAVDAKRSAHNDEVKANRYDIAIEKERSAKRLTDRAAAELQNAVDIDKAMINDYDPGAGPGALLVNLLQKLQIERETSARVARSLDVDPRAAYLTVASDARASAERIGTHSLMAKDSDDKDPCRKEAIALAKHASASVAAALFQRLSDSKAQPSAGTDWDSVLRHYMRYPAAGTRTWEESLLRGLDVRGRLDQPDVRSVGDPAKYPYLIPGKDGGRLEARRTGDDETKLQEFYRKFEAPS